MIVKLQEIWQDIDTLPEDAQILILDFIRLLKKCYSSTELENNISKNHAAFVKNPKVHPLDTFIDKYGAWEDERKVEEIVKEIYDSRTVGGYDISL